MPYVVEVRGAGGCWVQKRERYGALPEAELAVKLVRERSGEARLVEVGTGCGGWCGSGRRTCCRPSDESRRPARPRPPVSSAGDAGGATYPPKGGG